MQTVTESQESDQTPTSRRTRRTILLVAGAIVVVVVLAVVALRAARPNVLPNVLLADEDVSGMTRQELRMAVADMRARYASNLLTVKQGNQRRSATKATIGHTIDVEATVREVWRRGRQPNPITALVDHLSASFGPIRVSPVARIDEEAVSRWVDGTVKALQDPAVEGSVTFEGTEVQRHNPRNGTRPSPESVRAGTLAALDRPGSGTIEFETEAVAPQTTREDVNRLVETAERIVSAPVELTRGDETLTLDPEQLGRLFTTVQVERDGEMNLALRLRRAAVNELFSEEVRERFEVKPRDATVELVDGGPRVKDGRNGFKVNLDKAMEQIDELARSEPPAGGGARSAELEGDVIEPDRTTEEAAELQITQKVSSFTTEHPCCQGRVTNIHRFADLMDGVIIEPGETFSLNGHVGQRTAEKGFVAGGAIQQGEYVDEIGGGVSQFATTFFNAAYFGGYEIVEHKPHSYYISRYPMGRESTINYPNVDVKIRNNSPYGILVDTSYTDTSVTVTFWGRKWVDVESKTGQPHNYTSPETQVRTNPDLEPGSERVVQAGSNGFDIVVTRRLRYEDGTKEEQEFFTRYLPEPRIIERGPGGGGSDDSGD